MKPKQKKNNCGQYKTRWIRTSNPGVRIFLHPERPHRPHAHHRAPETGGRARSGGGRCAALCGRRRRTRLDLRASTRKPPPAKCKKARAFSARAFCPAAGFRGAVTRCVDLVRSVAGIGKVELLCVILPDDFCREDHPFL